MTGTTAFAPRAVLVTGAAGFIGANYVRLLQQTDRAVQIVSLDKLTYAGSTENLDGLPDPGRHTFVEGDICDRERVEDLLRRHQIDTIVHFAAESHVDRSIGSAAPFITTNLAGTSEMLEAARNVWLRERELDAGGCRFHHISTDEVYGQLTDAEAPGFTEETPYKPNSPYAASKAGSDHLVHAYHHTYGLPVTVSNCANNFGPLQHWEKLIPTVIRKAYQKQPIPIYGDGSNRREWIYVDDHCQAVDLIVRTGKVGEFYNVGGGREMDNLTLATQICEIMDKLRPAAEPHRELMEFVTDRLGHDWRYAINDAKIRSELGWTPDGKFPERLGATVAWYLSRLEAGHLPENI